MPALAVLFGLFIGGVTTAFVFLAGGLFAYGASVTIPVFLISGALMWLAVRAFWRITEAYEEDRLRLGVLIPVPILILSILILQSQPLLLQGLGVSAIVSLGSWLLWLGLAGLASALHGTKPPR